MSEVDENESTQKDELTVLKERATLMGINFHPNIGLEKLREKVNGTINDDVVEPEVESKKEVKESTSKTESPGQQRDRLRKDAGRLIRVNVTCMNPNKKEWEGEIFTVSNSVVGTFKKYVLFNTENGWHIPNIIYKQLVNRKCQIFQTTKGPNGQKIRKGKLIKEFSIDVLDPLTKKELDDLAIQQAMANNLD